MTDLRKAAQEAAKVLANALSIDFNDKRDWYSYKHDVEYATNLLLQALAQPEQKPKVWIYRGNLHFFDPSDWAEDEVIPLYTATPKREWVGLTDEEIDDLDNFDFDGYGFPINFARAIEAKLKEKNA